MRSRITEYKGIPIKEFLEEQYIKLKKPGTTISKETGISEGTVFKLLRRWDIPVRSKSEAIKLRRYRSGYDILTPEFMKKHYIDMEKSTTVIARELDIPVYGVLKRVKDYKLPIRPYGGQRKGMPSSMRSVKGCGDLSGSYWSQVKIHARNRNVEMEMTIQEAWDKFLQQDRKCALSGVEIVFAPVWGKSNGSQTASLDRIDSSKGYTVENTQWLHKRVNQMKMHHEQNDFIEWCQRIADKYRGIK